MADYRPAIRYSMYAPERDRVVPLGNGDRSYRSYSAARRAAKRIIEDSAARRGGVMLPHGAYDYAPAAVRADRR